MTNQDKNEKKRFWLFLVLAVVVGVAYLLWGQSNSAATLYELGFQRYKATAQLDNVAGWQRTAEEQSAYDMAAAEGATWAAANKGETGSYVTETAAEWFGDSVKLTLNYTLYRQANSCGTVILLHGFCGSTEEVQIWAPYWWDKGYNVLIPVQRGYADASDVNYVPTTWGVYEEFDLYDLIRAAGLQSENLLIHGKGTGAAAAILLCANDSLAAAGVDGLICETVYDNLGTVERDMVKELFNLGDWFVGRFLRERIRNNLGFEADSVDLPSAAANLKTPVLFLSGIEEDFLGETRTLAVAQACSAPHIKAALQGSYRGLWLTDGELYRSSVDDFLTEIGA